MFNRFWHAESGNFAIISAIALPLVVAGVGLSVDAANMMNAKTRLQNATDVAVLMASRPGTDPDERNEIFTDYLRVHLASERIKIAEAFIEVDAGINHLKLTGHVTAHAEMYFMDKLGARPISVMAEASYSAKSMEIALVLDNTGSMGSSGIAALKKAAHALMDAVEKGRLPEQDVRVSLIPFVTSVNIKGEGFDPDWIDWGGQSLYNGWSFLDDAQRSDRMNGSRPAAHPKGSGGGQACKNLGEGAPAIAMRERCGKADQYPHSIKLFELSGTTWKGCVEARPYPYNQAITAPDPAKPDTLFVPYFAPDEPGSQRTDNGGNDGNGYNNSWLHDEVTGSDAEIQRSTLKYVEPASKRVVESGQLTVGPNRACPTPVVPLTTEFKKVRDGIDAMQFWNGSGTNISEGLAWGWRMLSPEAPFTQAGKFNDAERNKYLVLMTDGRNVSFGSRNTMNRSDYGSYGFLDHARVDGVVNQGNAESKLNAWTLEMCKQSKKQGIEIFTVIYKEKASSVQELFKNCASRPEYFQMADDTGALERAFGNIGMQLSKLRLAK